MGTILQDLRYGLRMLAKKPGFAAVAVLTLALGIGANTAIFSVVNAVLLKGLPYKETDRLVIVWEQNPERGWYRNIVSSANFVDWRRQNHAFTGMAAVDPQKSFNLTGTGEPEEVWGEQVTTNLFSLLGVRPLIGRDFLPEEDKLGAAPVAILSHRLWQRRFGGDPTLVGKQISLNGASYTVVGVMPSSFYFPPFWRELMKVELWVASLDLGDPVRTDHVYVALARLKPGTSLKQPQAEMDTIARNIQRQYPEDKGWGVGLVPIHEQAVGDSRPALLVVFGAVGFVLLIACANVANLQLARATAREKEVAIRAALGASRTRLLRQFLTESLALALLGGALGLLLASWGVGILVALAPKGSLGLGGGAGLEAAAVNGRVLAFALAAACITGFGFGLAPALAAFKPGPTHSLKEGSRGSTEGPRRSRLRSALVVCEFTLALILLVGAGLMVKTMIHLARVDLGFNSENVLTMRIPLLGRRYKGQRDQAEFFKRLLERVKTLPGIQCASVSRGLPIEGWGGWGFLTEDNPSPPPNQVPDANYQVVGPDYFRAMGISLRKGRFFTEQDTEQSARVVVVNAAWARREWPGLDPIGKRLRVNSPGSPWLTVVGVAGNVKTQWPYPDALPEIYVPFTQYPWELAPRHLVIRTETKPGGVAAAVGREVSALDKELPVSDVRPLDQIVAEAMAQQRFTMVLLGVFAALALVLAAVGIYGVISYSVGQRVHEIGIRMALGAGRHDVLRMVVGQGLRLTAVGVAVGLLGSLALTRFLENLLYGVRSTDAATFVAVSLALTSVALLASYIPARRATKVDPMVALRYE